MWWWAPSAEEISIVVGHVDNVSQAFPGEDPEYFNSWTVWKQACTALLHFVFGTG